MQGFLPNTLKCQKSYYCSRCLVTAHEQEHKWPTIHDSLRSPSHEQDPRRFNALMGRVLRAALLMLNEQSNILTSTEKPTNSKADPQTETSPLSIPEERTPEGERRTPYLQSV